MVIVAPISCDGFQCCANANGTKGETFNAGLRVLQDYVCSPFSFVKIMKHVIWSDAKFVVDIGLKKQICCFPINFAPVDTSEMDILCSPKTKNEWLSIYLQKV